MRLFIAIEIPDSVKQQIALVQMQLKKAGADASWTRPEGIHLTLKFLGETDESKIQDLMNSLRTAVKGMELFRLAVSNAGAFPNLKNPRVLWIGLSGDLDPLVQLQESVEKEMQTLGFAPEERKFSPHLTLARIKYPKPRFSWQQAIEALPTIDATAFEVRTVSLMKSELRGTGAVYAEMGSVELESR
jgi:2'-5' RNA ligase